MKIEVYIDGEATPFEVLIPPQRLKLDTRTLSEGEHVLSFKTIDVDGKLLSQREIPFRVQNGPAISVHGLRKHDTVAGELPILVNAYSSEIGDEFEPEQIESPTPIPTWAWVLVMLVVVGAVGFLTTSLHQPREGYSNMPITAALGPSASSDASGSAASAPSGESLGQKVYGNNCSSCHQAGGAGLPGVFPPLKGNSVVLDEDATVHILAVLQGVQDKEIDGVAYASPMPGFADVLNDEEIAAVVNHERTKWGNSAKTVDAEAVKKLRK